MANLYELMGDFEGIGQLLEDESRPSSELDALMEEMESTKGLLRDKVDSICRLLANANADLTAYDAEIKRLQSRSKVLNAKKERLRSWVRTSMDLLDVKSIKTDLFSVTISPGKPSVKVLDIDKIPDEFAKVTRTAKKKDILKAYKDDGEVVPGTKVVDGEPTLRVN